jgi:hypothetical protein
MEDDEVTIITNRVSGLPRCAAMACVSVAAALVLLLPRPLGAQEFRGEVVDEAGRRLSDVAIGLFAGDRGMVADAVSDRDGSFSILAPRAGAYTVHFTRSGFRSVSGGPYELDPAEPMEAVVVLYRAPAILPGLEVEVEGQSQRLRVAGFYERRDKGFGRFIDRLEIERRGNVRMIDLLEPLPGLSVERGFGTDGPEELMNPALWFGRSGQRCVPALWIDGMLVRTGGFNAPPLRPDDFVWPLDAEGIEFYGGPSQVPIEYARSAGCAVLLVWTREPGRGG